MTVTTGTSATAETISVYQAIGGRGALTAAVDDFFGRLLADPVLGPFFPHGVGARHRAYLVTILGEALGGPERYRGRDIAEAHRGLGITDAHFDLAAAHLYDTLDGLGVPRHLSDQIVRIVAGLRPAVVTA
jgi:truncated hemoglobin YjbI